MGEQQSLMFPAESKGLGSDTYAGKIHVEWDPQAAVTPLGQLSFFISFLKMKPALVRGDIFLGNEGFFAQAEQRNAHYLTKLRLTANVKRQSPNSSATPHGSMPARVSRGMNLTSDLPVGVGSAGLSSCADRLSGRSPWLIKGLSSSSLPSLKGPRR